MTDGDVSLNGERQRQPDSSVADGVRQRTCDLHPIALIGRVLPERRVVIQRHRERQHEVEKVIDGKRREVTVRRRLHPRSRQNGDADGVSGDAEYHHQRHDYLLYDKAHHFQMASQRYPVIFAVIQRRIPDVGYVAGGHRVALCSVSHRRNPVVILW